MTVQLYLVTRDDGSGYHATVWLTLAQAARYRRQGFSVLLVNDPTRPPRTKR